MALRRSSSRSMSMFGCMPAAAPIRDTALRKRRELALEHEVPHVLERTLLREVDRRVLAVVVEALVPTDVADLCLGDDHALEALGHVDGRARQRRELRHPHEVAHRDDAD